MIKIKRLSFRPKIDQQRKAYHQQGTKC